MKRPTKIFGRWGLGGNARKYAITFVVSSDLNLVNNLSYNVPASVDTAWGVVARILADEKISWQGSLANQRIARDNLVGDILVCSGIIAYLGIFSMIYRQDCIKIWINMIKTFNIKSNEEISLNAILGNQVKIKDWLIKKLP